MRENVIKRAIERMEDIGLVGRRESNSFEVKVKRYSNSNLYRNLELKRIEIWAEWVN